jgi:hypothetical protein
LKARQEEEVAAAMRSGGDEWGDTSFTGSSPSPFEGGGALYDDYFGEEGKG